MYTSRRLSVTCCGDQRCVYCLDTHRSGIHAARRERLFGTLSSSKTHVKGADAADQALAVDDGNIGGIYVADHPPAVDKGHVLGTDTADHAPAVDHGNIKGTNAADRPPVVDDGNLGGTDTDPDSTPRISREDKAKGVNLREYGPLMLDGSLFTGSLAQRIGQGRRRNAGTFHPHIVPKVNTTFRPKSQTAGHHIVHVDDGNIKSADEHPDYTPRISWEDKRIVQGPNDETFHPHISPKTNTTIYPKSQTVSDDGSDYTVPEFSFMDDDDEATDQKVLAGTSTQTDLSPAFGLALPPPQWTVKGSIIMDPDKKSMQRRRIGASWGSSSRTQICPHTTILATVRLPDELMSSPDPVPSPKPSPPDFPEFKYQEILSPKVTPNTRSLTDGHPRRPYRDEAESDGSSASMPNPKNQHKWQKDKEAKIGRVIVVLAHIMDLMVFIEDSPDGSPQLLGDCYAVASIFLSHLGGYL
ncbi:hypothetical protein BU17DRAFT_101581 [Hysterangium stoloniferum]|nr:hypothetical protein BU17DRAFT_101581 [Hysterangium stoloniferum]